MTTIFRIVFLALGLLASLSPGAYAEDSRNLAPQASVAESRRVALVIGNSDYPISPLKNPVNDARAIALKLKSLGFEVILKENVAQKEMSRAVTRFGELLGQGNAMGLFYFAGHGFQSKGKNYLVPIDAQITSEASVHSEALDVDVVLEQLNYSPLNIVILDACRNNPFERRFRGASGGLVQMDAPKGTLIAYATAPGKVASDGEGKNGLYTGELLKVLGEPGLKVEDVFKRVRANVAKATADQQLPWESSSLTGDFYFHPDTAQAQAATADKPAPSPAAMDTGIAIELKFWESAESGNTAADYASYLNKFPDGQFAEMARNRMKQLSGNIQLANVAPTPPILKSGPVDIPPLPKVGDFWRYRGSNENGFDNPTYRVANVTSNTIELRFVSNKNEQRIHILRHDWNLLSEHGQTFVGDLNYSPQVTQYLYPLEPGKKWRDHFKGKCGMLCSFEVDSENEVRGWEKVTVPAGTFDALRIESRQNFRHAMGLTSTGLSTVWLAPEIKRPVKFNYSYDGNRVHEYELEAWQIAE